MARALTKAGRYQIVSELGRGSMGVVYQGFDPVIGRTVAIKTMLIEGLSSSEFSEYKARFQREAQAAGILAHPNIVTVYDFGEDEGILFLAMEFLEGSSLQDLVEKQNILPIETIVPIFEQVCSALDHAHKNNIVHRDIKPANIMILNSGLVKVTDFGIAKIMSMGMTQAGQILGTPNYMSPEQVKGRAVDGRSDIFAMGVILYELVTGEKPFGGQNITTVIYKIINENPIPPRELDSTIHPGLSFVISKALAKSPDERFQTCRELAEALKNYRNLASEPAPSATVVIKVPPIQSTAPEPPLAPPPTPTRQVAPPALKKTRAPQIEPLAGDIQPAPRPAPAPPREQPPARPAVPPPAFAAIKPPPKGTSPIVWTLLALLVIGGVGGGSYYYFFMRNGRTVPAAAPPTTAPATTTPSTSGAVNAGGEAQTATEPTGEQQPATAEQGQGTETGQPAAGTQPQTPTQLATPGTTPETKQPTTTATRETPPPVKPAPETSPALLYGKILVKSVPLGAQISVDGQSDPDWVTPHVIEDLKGGAHRLTLSAQGYTSKSQTIRVRAGKTTPVNVALARFKAPETQTGAANPHPPPKTQGTAVKPPVTASGPSNATETGIWGIKTKPPGVEVVIDGKSYGPSPVTATLPAGEHSCVIKMNGVEVSSYQVKLGAGEMKYLTVNLEPQ